ncbi:O-antigen ligase family protein [Chryseobacterium balustinum]|uniref:O-antigen ligase family protein n=1 Tax=Chryseobacterium balustinum TaxID=246 RepID=UPI000F4D99A2|nr:O-antigen ligase family protein [Chryseobacterium balustinum]AZB28241.1 O-antigen ligase domain-containing protein [Chryseobacterium balustinum]
MISFGIGMGILSILFAFNILGASSFDIRNDRLFFLGENPNSLSVRTSLGILFLVMGVIENGLRLPKFFRFLLAVPIPFMFNLLLASGSKGSFILCILSVVIYILLLKNISKRVKRFVIFSALIISTFVFNIFLNSALYNRFLDANITSGRSDIWESAYDIFVNNPFGVGEIGYKVEINIRQGKIIDTHNLFIYLAVTGGLFALIIFMYFLAVLLIKNIKQYKREKNIIYLIIFFSMVFIMSKTGGVLLYLIMWYFLACINGSLNKSNSLKIRNEK